MAKCDCSSCADQKVYVDGHYVGYLNRHGQVVSVYDKSGELLDARICYMNEAVDWLRAYARDPRNWK